jgi:hypothetical protein
MTTDRRAWVRSQIEKDLENHEREMLKSINIEERKDCYVFRMPKGIIPLQGIWEKIEFIAKTHNIPVKQGSVYATLEELDDVLSDIEWLWRKWVPKGFITLLVGDPKIGKTTVALDFARIITTGDRWPFIEKKEEPGRVIWVDAEAGQQVLRERAISLGINRKNVFIPVINGDILASPDFTNSIDRENISNMVESIKPALLVLDSLGGANRRGENKVEDVRPLLEYLAGMARDRNIGILLLHHLNKSNDRESPEVSLYRIRGSTAIPAFCRSILAEEEGKTDAEKKLKILVSNLASIKEDDVLSLIYESKDEQVSAIHYDRYKAPPEKRSKKERCAEWVLEVLALQPETPFSSLIEMGEGLEYNRKMLYSAKDALGDRVTISGSGNSSFWSLSDNGDQESMKKVAEARKNGK